MVTSEWPSDGRGTAHFIARQAQFLREAGVDVDVIPFRGSGRLVNYTKAWIRVRAQLRRFPYDLVHAQFGQSSLLALPKRVPLVVTLRGSDILGLSNHADGSHPWKGKLLQNLTRFGAQHADEVIVVSAHMKAYLPPSVSAHVIPSGIDFDLFRCIPRGDARQQLGLSPDERFVLFVGNPAYVNKRYQLAQQAIDMLNHSLPTRLLLAWNVLHTDIPVYMSASDALLFTSIQEGSPNVVKEALACNLPVVSVPVGDVAERIQGVAGCELCTDTRPEAIAAALERVLMRNKRVQGREAVFSLDEKLLTKRVIDVYRSALAHRLPRLVVA
jgi:glycosyltransferase involved in cell wall biosynthesis